MILVDDDHVNPTAYDEEGAATRVPGPIDPLPSREPAELDVLGEYRALFSVE